MKGTVLITGSDGFTGRYVAQKFYREGWEVWGSGLKPADLSNKYAHIDLLNPNTLNIIGTKIRPDVVIHLAAVSFVAEENASAYYQVNVLGTKHLLDALSKGGHSPRRIMIASSAAVYGNAGQRHINENHTLAPVNDYGVSKVAVEHLARTYCDRLPVTVVRPFNYTGVSQRLNFVIPKIVGHFRERRKTIVLGNLDVSRDISDVRDIANIYFELSQVDGTYEALNLCSGVSYSLENIMRTCQELSGHALEVMVGAHLVRDREIKHLCGDRTRIQELLGLKPPRSIEDTLGWMLENPTLEQI